MKDQELSIISGAALSWVSSFDISVACADAHTQ